MKSIGFKCWGDRFSYVILEGTQETPSIIKFEHRKAPKNISRAEQLQWLRREVHEILDRNNVDCAFYKAVEPISRTKDLERGQFEGVLLEAAISHKTQLNIDSRIKVQIGKAVKSRKPRYIGEVLENKDLEAV